ncbi:MAG: oligosaccharide flippase family protein, partial [Chloroflexota bacterium]
MLPVDNLFQWQPWASAAAELGVGAPHNSLLSDLILQNYVWRQFIVDSLAAGEIPLWNPYLFGGAPFLAAGQSAAYYPFSIFFLVLPLVKAYGWYTVSQLWLAGVFAYLFGRVMRMRRASAALMGLVYQGSGFLLVSAAVFPMILGAAIWLPFLLLCLEMVARASMSPRGAGRTLPWAALGAVALGCQILAGHIEITYYTLLVMAAYAAWRLLTRARYRAGNGARSDPWRLAVLKTGGWFLALVLMGLMLGAIQFIPFYEVGSANFREGAASLDEVRGWAFPERRVLTLALPSFFGNPTHHSYVDVFSGERTPFTLNAYGNPNPRGAGTSDWGLKNYVEGGVYLGILPLLLVPLGILSWRRRSSGPRSAIAFFSVLSLLSLAFIFGTPLYALLYYGLPGINQLHSPFRWVFPLSLAVAALAGYGMDYVAATRDEAVGDAATGGSLGRRWASDLSVSPWLRPFFLWARPSAVTLLAGIAFWVGLVLVVGLLASRLFYAQLEPLLESVFMGLALAPEAFPSTRAFYSYQFRNILILALTLIASGIVLRVSRCPFTLPRLGDGNRKGQRPLWPLLALVVLGLDLLVANWGFHTAADPALLAYEPDLVQWLQEQPGQWRLTTFTPRGNKPLNANTPWMHDLQDVRGYDSIIPRQYVQYMRAIEPQNELLFNRIQPVVNWESLNSPLLDLLGVRYVVTDETISLPKYERVWQGEGLNVYENLGVVPRAYTLPQSATVVVDDALEAMRERDGRQYVMVESGDWGLENGDWSIANLQSPVSGSLQPAEIADYSNIEVTANATVEEPSWLVLNDSYFPGWKVFVKPEGAGADQEEEQPVVRVNGNFRATPLEPGSWTVRFRYSPMTFRLGGLTSGMAGIVLLFVFGVWGWRRFYNPQGELGTVRSLAKNSLVPTVLNLLNRSIDFLFAAFYLRVLGPVDAGSYANAIAVAGWFEIISNFGLNTLVIREVSQDKSKASEYLLNTVILRLVTTVLAAVPIFIYLWAVNLGGNPLGTEAVAAILLLMVGMIFSGAAQSFTGLYYAFETAETPAAIATVTTIMKVALGVVALLLGYGFVGLAGVSIVVNIITLLILGLAAFRRFVLRGPWRVSLHLQRRMLVDSYPLMLNHLFATIFFFVDVPLMQQINGDEAVGWYNSAYKWVNALNVIPSFFTFALFPVISRQIRDNLREARRTFRLSIKLMALISLPVAAVTTLLAPTLIGVLGGAEYLPDGAVALQIIIWSIPVGWINSVTNYVLIALGQERVQVRAFFIAVAFNVVTNLIFLPLFSYRAAAVTTILSEVLLLLIFNMYLRERMPAIGWGRLLWRPLAVTLIMIVLMALGATVHPALGLLLGIAFFPLG